MTKPYYGTDPSASMITNNDAIAKGDWVYLLEYTLNGEKVRHLYLYETARSFDTDLPKNLGIEYKLDRIQWDGEEYVSFYNGD